MRRAKKGLAILASTVLMVTSAVNYHGLTFSVNVYSEETSNEETVSESGAEEAVAQMLTEAQAEVAAEAPVAEVQEAAAQDTPANAEVPEQSEAQEVTMETVAAETTMPENGMETIETVEAETATTAVNTVAENDIVTETEATTVSEESKETSEFDNAIKFDKNETEAEDKTEEEYEVETEEYETETEYEIGDFEGKWDDEGIMVTSLLPLDELTVYLVLEDKTENEIKNMSIDEVLNSLQDSDGNKVSIPEDATTAWKKDGSNKIEEYIEYPLGQNVKIDLYKYNSAEYTMEFIVGSKSQLDRNNKRYLINVSRAKTFSEMAGTSDEISWELYFQDESGARTQVMSDNTIEGEKYWFFDGTAGVWTNIKTISIHDPNYWSGKEYYLGLCSSASDCGVDVDIYTYEEFTKLSNGGTYDGTGAETCTDQILNQDMTQKDSGMKGTYEDNPNDNTGRLFAIRYRNPDNYNSYEYCLIEFSVMSDAFKIDESLYAYDGENMVDVVSYKHNRDENNEQWINSATGEEELFNHVECQDFHLKYGYTASDVYYLINMQGGTSGVIKAVEGLYQSLEQATDQPDIKEQLIFSDSSQMPKGYQADYTDLTEVSDHSYYYRAYFTIFGKNNSVLNLKVNLTIGSNADNKDNKFTEAPIIGEVDPWFRICGVKQNDEEISTFIVQNGTDTNLDTMYGYGYQTVLIQNETVDLSRLQPIWTVDSDHVTKVTVDGKEVKSGQVIDCSSGSVQYTIIVDGHQKNYQVSFVKATPEAKLFVAGPQTQEVFFNSDTEYKHDIFIANLGQEELIGLKVELDATNCKLDNYWTVGGEDNDTLASFDSVTASTQNGLLGNAAKIRLVPLDNEGGAIQGTLTVYADGQEPIVINLIGYSKNPKIVTDPEEFNQSTAVKYVPYSYMITTDNMYDWVSVSYELASGVLPAGVELYPDTGEIYGVPEEAGTFSITVEAKFTSKSSYEFGYSYVDLVLMVEENTAENVFKASSEGYEIKQALGTDMGDYNFVLTSFEDAVFVSYGEFSEYCGVWLNGNKLEEGKDYDAESGSTRITIYGETFENTDYVNQDGENTIAIEFRKGGNRNEELKRTSQNFTINAPKPTEPDSKPTVEPTTTEPTEKVTTAQATTKEEPTTVTKSEEPKSAASSTDTPETASTAKENETSASSTETTAASVKCTVKMVDAENKAIDNLSLELHSTPQMAVTDANGCAAFGSIEFGSHTLYVKNTDGTTEGSISFTIAEGNALALNGNVITAPNGADFILLVRYDQNKLEFVSVHNNDSTSLSVILGIEDYAEWIGAFLFGIGIAMAMCLCAYAISSAARRRK